jgi:hypothetical protein
MAAVADGNEEWRVLAARLVAVVSLFDHQLAHDHTPDITRGVEVLDAGRLLTERLEILATRIGTTYRDRLDEPTLARLRAAVRQLQATADALTGLPEALGQTTTDHHPDTASRHRDADRSP